MDKQLKSPSWADTMEAIRVCHLSMLTPDCNDSIKWKNAFEMLCASIKDERKLDPAFATELIVLTEETGVSYDFADILEEYFDYLEDKGNWDDVVSSCDELIALFKWENTYPSQYMFRKGNALMKAGKLSEAESFGAEWLKLYPTDLYAAASNVFLKTELGKFDEARELTEKYLRDDLLCDDNSNTFYMAAYRLYELTDDINAKRRIETKMAEYQSRN